MSLLALFVLALYAAAAALSGEKRGRPSLITSAGRAALYYVPSERRAVGKNSGRRQTTSTVLMIEPVAFGFNPDSAPRTDSCTNAKLIWYFIEGLPEHA